MRCRLDDSVTRKIPTFHAYLTKKIQTRLNAHQITYFYSLRDCHEWSSTVVRFTAYCHDLCIVAVDVCYFSSYFVIAGHADFH